MTAEDLPLALSRHATSKIDGSDLLAIILLRLPRRGAALAGRGRAADDHLARRGRAGRVAHRDAAGGRSRVRPAALARGTVVELRDLFFATPARLKFLRTDRAEAQAIAEVVRRLAMAEPPVGFTLRDVSGGGEGRVMFRADPEPGDFFDALHGRLRAGAGRGFRRQCPARSTRSATGCA